MGQERPVCGKTLETKYTNRRGAGKEVASATVMKIFVVLDLKVKPTHLYELVQETWNAQRLHKGDHPGHLNSV